VPVREGFRAWADKARLSSQLLFLVLFAVLISGALCVFAGPGITALEPVGFLQVVAAGIRAQALSLGLIAVTGTLAFVLVFVIFGGAFCGWVCPVGTVSDLVGRARKPSKLRPKEKKVEGFFANVPSREAIALSVVGASLATGKPAWCPICPIGGICRSVGLNGLVGGAEVVAFAAMPAVGEAKSKRWFCRHLCPVGGMIASIRRYVAPTFKLQVNEDVCTECMLCFKDCPYDIKPFDEKELNNCILCLKCYQSCPFGDGIEIKVRA
jgi:ferredoxin-type protein NapH